MTLFEDAATHLSDSGHNSLHRDSNASSDDSVLSLQTISDFDSNFAAPEDHYNAPEDFSPVFIPFEVWFLNPWTVCDHRAAAVYQSQVAYIKVTLYYPTLLAEIARHFLIQLEVHANERNRADLALKVHTHSFYLLFSVPCCCTSKIHLPMCIKAMRALPHAVWQTFWANIVGLGLCKLLSDVQHNLLQDLILVFCYFSMPIPDATERWQAFIEHLQTIAKAGAQFNTPGE